MIRGIGTDIVRIERIEKAMCNPRFAQRILSETEMNQWRDAKNSAQRLAGHWAAKEAAVKALGTGFRGIGLKDVELLHNSDGAPILRVNSHHSGKWWISLTHDAGVVIAFVIMEDCEQ